MSGSAAIIGYLLMARYAEAAAEAGYSLLVIRGGRAKVELWDTAKGKVKIRK
jgi:hypothetical protein